jgi:hypothetical protein
MGMTEETNDVSIRERPCARSNDSENSYLWRSEV